MEETLYNTLKVKEDAPPEIIRAAYKALSGMYHPDKNSSAEANELMQKINGAYRILRDPEMRARYDESLRKTRAQAAEQQRPRESPKAASAEKIIKPIASSTFFAWSSWLPIIVGVIAVKLLGFVGALSAMGLYYWVKPRKGSGIASIAAIVGGSAAAIAAATLLHVQQPGQQVASVPQAPAMMQPTVQQPQVEDRIDPPAHVPSAQEMHMQRIYEAHPDAYEIFRSSNFAYWLERTPKFKNTPSDGTTQEIIDMFSSYKRAQTAIEREIRQKNDAAAEALSRQYEPVYPR
jgi:hypothetical protein